MVYMDMIYKHLVGWFFFKLCHQWQKTFKYPFIDVKHNSEEKTPIHYQLQTKDGEILWLVLHQSPWFTIYVACKWLYYIKFMIDINMLYVTTVHYI